jgi:uncharacterized protein involved in high-affinity Fe2+ transport
MTRLRSALVHTLAVLAVSLLLAPSAHAQEKVMGTEIVDPGIQLEVIAAPKDAVRPLGQNLPKDETDIHLEVLATWASDASVDVPNGAQRGGFVGFLNLFGKVTNERTGAVVEVELVPHINLSDNLHYARNVDLPGDPSDPFTVTLNVRPPQELELATHRDWRAQYGDALLEATSFTYTGVDLSAIAAATR